MSPSDRAATLPTRTGSCRMAFQVKPGTDSVVTSVFRAVRSSGTGEMYRTAVPPASCSPYTWSMYRPPPSAMRCLASFSSSSRSPKRMAPLGQVAAQAGSIPSTIRS
ncbi:hypothetical protein [Symbiobacterium thermophilum]|uniref:hypothetical protein n=1 Tax=Symbiobacterium thermophilum TaxID=2734 RepID=UPI0035C732CF